MMKAEYRAIDSIAPYENNPRIITEEAITRVAESIKRYGFKQPIVVDGNGVIAAGHVRYEAAKKLGLVQVPVVVLDKLTDEEVKAYRLADNKSRELSEWDFEKLDFELAEIAESGSDFDLEAFGLVLDVDAYTEKKNASKEQKLGENEEFSIEDFDEEHFDYCCPKCGMRFNKK